MKYLLDTNVYLEAFRSEDKQARFRKTFFPLLPATFLSAVVAYELSVNAQDRRTPTLLKEFIHPMERMGRVVTWRSKLPGLLNDILIALCARQIGALLFTYNRADFRLIRRHIGFSLRLLEG